MIVWVIIFIVLFALLYFKPGNKSEYTHTSTVFPLLLLLLLFSLLLFSSTSIKSANYGLNLAFTIVIPSLFPFLVCIELIKGTSLIHRAGKIFDPIMKPIFNIPGAGSFAFVIGLISGYPIGAKVGAELYEQGLCSKNQAERLIAFSNNSNPAFITGAVAVGIFGRPELGLLLLMSHYLGSISVGVLFGLHSRISCTSTEDNRSEPNQLKNFDMKTNAMSLSTAIINSINTSLMIGGYIVIFCVLVSILYKLKVLNIITGSIKFLFFYLGYAFNLAMPISSGLFEITNGINLVKLSFAPLYQKVAVASFILGWGGLSVHAQVSGIISKYGLNIKPYLIGKFLQGILSAIYSLLLLKFFLA